MTANRKKVLIACNSSRTLLQFRGKLIEELVAKNDVYVFTPKISQEHVKEKLKSLNVTVYENELKGNNISIFSDLKYIVQLYHLIKEIKPDIFFPYTFKPVIYGTVVANLCKIDCITPMLTGLGYNFTDKNTKKRWVSTITKVMLKFSLSANKRIRIIFQNRDDYLRLVASGIIGIKHQAFVVNGSGVDLTDYTYSVPETKVISFLMISRLINAKGVKEFYEAAKLVREKFPGIKFKLIGAYDGNIDAIDPELYANIRSGEVIQYIGQVDDVKPYIRNASIVVLPSYYGEGVPRCILEGMAMGRAVITCDSVGCRETINPSAKQPNGFLIPIKNISALAAKMEHYINHSRDILVYGLNGRRFAKQKFDVNLVNAAMLKIMELS
ncbi:glycosyltransferase family 4 protein [Pedobacter nyackensis]|uniref:glycosyltransferase family 4 protein n=1 Tax=Pedobacter nyackensis TaxID=475255 RepID=UPI00292EBFF1|nr:glycosyltransferase family 4 protein [Pedobacter nyackensis]